jgi:hypothetical protein
MGMGSLVASSTQALPVAFGDQDTIGWFGVGRTTRSLMK